LEKNQNYRIITPNKEVIFTKPGKNGPDDMKIFTQFPKIPWPHSLYYIATCLRLKGIVEDRNYSFGKGKQMLIEFCGDAISNYELTIAEICKKYKIPGF
jgi:hypothetical protein